MSIDDWEDWGETSAYERGAPGCFEVCWKRGPDGKVVATTYGGAEPKRVVALVLSIFGVVFSAFFLAFAIGYVSLTPEGTVDREPLSSSLAQDIGYYIDDDVGWFCDTSQTETAMRYFQEKTGVAPVLVLTRMRPSHKDFSAMVRQYQRDNISDEAHLVLLFNEHNDYYRLEYAMGSEAASVLDREAMHILMDHIDGYYTASSLSNDELFARAFKNSADKIMGDALPPLLVFVPAAVLFWVCLIAAFVAAFRIHKK